MGRRQVREGESERSSEAEEEDGAHEENEEKGQQEQEEEEEDAEDENDSIIESDAHLKFVWRDATSSIISVFQEVVALRLIPAGGAESVCRASSVCFRPARGSLLPRRETVINVSHQLL
jgi:hypothetical protein